MKQNATDSSPTLDRRVGVRLVVPRNRTGHGCFIIISPDAPRFSPDLNDTVVEDPYFGVVLATGEMLPIWF